MTKHNQISACIVGSFIQYMINSLLPTQEKYKGSVLALNQKLMAKTRKPEMTPYVILSNQAWSNTINAFEDEKIRLIVFDAIEYLSYDNEKVMKLMYGDDIITYVDRAVMKLSYSGTNKELFKESRKVTDELTKQMRKSVFDYVKDERC